MQGMIYVFPDRLKLVAHLVSVLLKYSEIQYLGIDSHLAGNIIMVGPNPVGRGETQRSKERVRGEDEAGEDREVERHQHGELPPLVHCLHHPQEQRLQNLRVV